MNVKEIDNLYGKKVLVRVGFDITIQDGVVSQTEDWRIKSALPTLEFLREKGAKIIIISHIGRDPEVTIRPVAEYLNKLFPVSFVPEVVGNNVEKAVASLGPGEAILLENLRQDKREIANDDAFAKELASLGDVFVNEAFLVSHRAHASIVGIPQHIPSYFGFQFENEIRELSGILENPKRPLLLILGGAKFETKLPLIEKFLKHADFIFVGGALVNNFFKESGYEVGQSLLDTTADISPIVGNPKLIIPEHVISYGPNGDREINPKEVGKDEKILDIGLSTIESLKEYIDSAGTILWNGPMGNYENGYGKASALLAQYIARSDAYSIAGGGDTVVILEETKMFNKFNFVSTGGGAMLEFLISGTLSGIQAIFNTYGNT